MPTVFEAARKEPLPEAARKFMAPAMKRLVALCRVLQRAAVERGQETFWLSCRVAGEFLGVGYKTASRWLSALQHAGVIFCTKLGNLPHGSKQAGRASEYRYLGD